MLVVPDFNRPLVGYRELACYFCVCLMAETTEAVAPRPKSSSFSVHCMFSINLLEQDRAKP
jgi:hypothetical protein